MIQLKNDFVEKFKDNNFNINIKETGLGKGEKIREILSINKKMKKTKINGILETRELKYSNNDILLLLKDLNELVEKYKEREIIARMKNFLEKEIFKR